MSKFIIEKMRYIVYSLYRIILMEYIEPEKYWDMFCNECDEIVNKIVKDEK